MRDTMSIRIFLVVPMLSALTLAYSDVEPTSVKSQIVLCVEQTTITTKKEVCYVIDTKSGAEAIEVTVGAGVHWDPPSGRWLVGGSAEFMLESTMRFPTGTAVADAIKSAQKKLMVLLTDEKVAKILKSEGYDYDPEKLLKKDFATYICPKDDDLLKELDRLTGDAKIKRLPLDK